MKQVILFFLFLSGCFAFMQEVSAGAPERLWYQSALDNGGERKVSMIERKMATADVTSCGAILKDTWIEAQRYGVKVEVPEELQPSFSMALFHVWAEMHGFSCAPDTQLSWEQFGEMGRLHDGFLPLEQDDVDRAVALLEKSVKESVTPISTTVESVVSDSQSAETAGVAVQVETSQPVSPPTTSCRWIPIYHGDKAVRDKYGNVKSFSTCREPIPSQEEMEADAKASVALALAEEEAERKAVETAEQEAEVEAEKTETVTQGDSQEQAETAEETRPWRIPQYQWDMEQRKRERPRHRPRHVDSSRYHAEEFIRRYFHDIPIMVKVAGCESTFDNVQSRERYQKGDRRGQQERSFGFFQIHELAWHDDALALGLSDYQTDPIQNLQMARHVYETQGLQAWEKCAKDLGLL